MIRILRLFIDLFRKIKNWIVNSWLKSHFRAVGDNTILSPFSWLVHPEQITIGANCTIKKECCLTAWQINGQQSEIIIGDDVSIGMYCHITATNKIIIRDGVLMGKWVTITDNSHGHTDFETLNIMPAKRSIVSKGPVVIEKNVWIGDKATILPGVTVGQGSIIGANAVVSKSVPPFSTVVGNPGVLVKRKDS